MRARFGSTALLLLSLLLSLLGASRVYAERQPQDPIVLWGIQKDCQLDFELSQAVQGSIDALGAPIHPVELSPGRARSCLGPECAELLEKSCGAALPMRGVLIGGHVAEQVVQGRYQARIRVFRVDFERDKPARSYYRYERVERSCSAGSCREGLASLVSTIVGQLLGDTQSSSEPPGMIHSARPPYCLPQAAPEDFLCQPFQLRQTCAGDGAASDAGLAQCPFGGRGTSGPTSGLTCNCADPNTCSAESRAQCTQTTRSPLLRRAVGGSLIAAGIALIGTGLLLTLNNHSSLTLRSGPACSPSGEGNEKCYISLPGVALPWAAGIGLTVGGALVLLDPLSLFRDRPSSGK